MTSTPRCTTWPGWSSAGEDPRFIARRLVISASEDIGMADPTALLTAVAAADAVAFIGMPEGHFPLAQAVVHLATAPKSNAVTVGIERVDRRRARRPGRTGAPGPARRPLRGGEEARPRQDLRLPARAPRRRRPAAVPARRAGRARTTTGPRAGAPRAGWRSAWPSSARSSAARAEPPPDRRTTVGARDYCDHAGPTPRRPGDERRVKRGTGDPACPQESGPD